MISSEVDNAKNLEPLNLYSQLFDQIDRALRLHRQGQTEESIEFLTKALKEWDKEQAYESYIRSKILVGEQIDINSFHTIISTKKIKDFNRVLAKLGLGKELVESLKLGSKGIIEYEDKGTVYFSIVAPALDSFGIEYFIDFLLYLREANISKVNGLQNILTHRKIIEKTEDEKRQLVRQLMSLGFDFYKKKTEIQKIDGTISKFSVEDVSREDWLDLFGIQTSDKRILEYLTQISAGNFSDAAVTINRDDIWPAVKREWVFKILTTEAVSELGSQKILDLIKDISQTRISDSYYFVYNAAIRLIKIGLSEDAIELVRSQTSFFKEFNELKNLPYWNSISTRNKTPNLKILRGQVFENYADIRNSLLVFRHLDDDFKYQRYILDFFNSSYPESYSGDYLTDLRNSSKNTSLKSAIDYYFELQLAAKTGDVDYWKLIYSQISTLDILDERHLHTGLVLADEIESSEFRNWVLSIFPERFKSSTYFLSAQIEHALNTEDYEAILDLLLDWKHRGLEIREQEVVGIARNSKPSHFSSLFDLFASLDEGGIAIPGKAITSMCERFSTRNDETSILKIVERFSESVGPEIAYAELQLILLYIRQERISEARLISEQILKRDIDDNLRQHIQKIFSGNDDPRISDVLDALKFEFKAEPNSNHKVVYKRNVSAISRSRDIVKELKQIYDDLCQICRQPLETPFGRISEAAHVQGLGHPHNGPDDLGNLICLCPNHHKLFDSSSFYLTDDFEAISTISGTSLGHIYVSPDHELDLNCIKYQRGYAVSASAKGVRKWTPSVSSKT